MYFAAHAGWAEYIMLVAQGQRFSLLCQARNPTGN